MVFFPLINKRSFKKLIVLYNRSFLFLLLLPAALISRNMVLLESCHQIFRVGWSHCLLQLPEVPKAESEFLHQRVNELTQLCPSTKPPSPRIYRIWLPRQKKQIPNFLDHIKDLSLRPFHCTSGLSAVENPTWAPTLLETVVWDDAALPPLCPQSKAVLYHTNGKTVTSLQMVKCNFCYLLLYKLPLPTSQKVSTPCFHVKDFLPMSEADSLNPSWVVLSRLHKISPEASSTANAV